MEFLSQYIFPKNCSKCQYKSKKQSLIKTNKLHNCIIRKAKYKVRQNMSQPNQQFLAQLKETFKMFDMDGDGAITMEELKQVIKKFGSNATEQQFKIMIKEVDKNGNGTIELNEYIDVMTKKSRNVQSDENSEMITLFKFFDKNGDGLISAQQLQQAFDILGDKGEPMKEQDIKQLLEAADIDGDGYINFEEFAKMLKFK